MNNFFRALIAGYGAKKLGGGCFGTIIAFILIWVALGQCSLSSRHVVPPPETYPADRRVFIPAAPATTRHLLCDLDGGTAAIKETDPELFSLLSKAG